MSRRMRNALLLQFSATADTTAPTVTITSTETSPSYAATIPITITFSEAVTGFAVGDITAAGCTLGSLSTADNITFSVTATPTANTMTLDIAANVCVDGAGNNNAAATQFVMVTGVLEPAVLGNGALPSPWTGTAFAIASNKVKNTPTEETDVTPDPGFDTGTGWSAGTDWTIGSGVATKVAGAATGLTTTGTIRPINRFYRHTATITRSAGVLAVTNILGGLNLSANISLDCDVLGVTTPAISFLAGATYAGTVDNVTYEPLTLNTLIAGINTAHKDAIVKAKITDTSIYHWEGVVANVDSLSTPKYFLVAALLQNGPNRQVLMLKCVNGVYTYISGGTVSYVAGKEVEIRTRRDGANLLATPYYNGVATSVEQTISDAGIVDNTIHGIFSTSNGVDIGTCTITTNP